MNGRARGKLLYYIYILFKEILVYHFIETINLNILKSSKKYSNNEVENKLGFRNQISSMRSRSRELSV